MRGGYYCMIHSQLVYAILYPMSSNVNVITVPTAAAAAAGGGLFG